MTSLLWLALATFITVQSKVVLLDRHDEGLAEQYANMRRGVRSVEKDDFDEWMTDDQKESIKGVLDNPLEFKKKIMEFYNALPEDTQRKWDKKYKKECTSWIQNHISQEAEENFLSEVADGSFDKWDELIGKIPAEERERHNVWKDECKSLLMSPTRLRRELDSNLIEFTKWMTPEQKSELETLKSGGKSLTEIRAKSMEFFNALPADKQANLREEYKGTCKAYFGKIATETEMEEVKALYESGNKGEIAGKISAVVGRQPNDVKAVATKMQAVCTDVYGETRKRKRDLNAKIEKHLSWLSDEQKQTIVKMKNEGKSATEIKTVILGWLSQLDSTEKDAAKEQTRKTCYKWLEDAATKKEIEELHKLHETDHNACKTKVREYIKRLNAQTQIEVNKNLPFCEKVWYGDHASHGSHDHAAHDHGSHGHNHRKRRALGDVKKFIDWFTPDQIAQLEDIEKSDVDFTRVLDKIKEFYLAESDDKKEKLKIKFKEFCGKYISEQANNPELQKARRWRAENKDEKLETLFNSIEDHLTEDIQETVEQMKEICHKVWDIRVPSRRRREHSHEDFFEKYLSWTTEAQKLDLKMIKEGGDRDAFYKKVMEFFEEAKGDTRNKAIEELKAACKHFSKDLFGEEKVETIKKMRQEGATTEAVVAKLKEFANSIEDETKKEKANKLVDGCRGIFEAKTSRRRRDQHGRLNEKAKSYFGKYENENKNDDESEKEIKPAPFVHNPMFYQYFINDVENYDEQEAKAIEDMKKSCEQEALVYFGHTHITTVRALWESQGRNRIHKEKVRVLVESIEDLEIKGKAARLVGECRHLYSTARRLRRDHEHTLEEAFQSFLSWTTDEQKEALRSLKAGGADREEIFKKVLEYFEGTTGDDRKKATEELKGACKHFGADLIGAEKIAALKVIKESGGTFDDIKKKIEELIGEITDEDKKTKAKKLSAACSKIYTAASRKKRDHHHTLEEASKYLTWTTQEQKDALKAMETAGNKADIPKKILEYFEATTGETKKKAAEELKGACKHYGVELFGEEKVNSLKALKESGASDEELKKKVLELVNEITDDAKKGKASSLVAGCEKVYKAASRKRRDHSHNLDDAFSKYLTWTTQEQKDALKALETSGDKESIPKRIMEYFDATSGDARKIAAEELKGACKHYGVDLFGEEKVKVLKELKESGASHEELKKKVLELVGEITDETKKAKAQNLVDGCEKIYSAASRKRRHQHNLDDAFLKYLTWTTQEQKNALKALETSGDKEAIYKKIMEFFEATTGDVRKTATEELKGACKHYGVDIFGEEKVDFIKKFRESGASHEDLKKKISELVEQVIDEEDKTNAQKLVAGCEKIYSAASRKRREHEHKLDDAIPKYLSWTTADQQHTLKTLEAAGEKEIIYKKILEYFKATSGETRNTAIKELKGACKHMSTDLFGEEGVASIRALRESGATLEEIKEKMLELVNGLTDEKNKAKAQKLAEGCEVVYRAAATRKRRNHHHSLEDAFTKYLTWTTEEQRDELKKLKEAGDRQGIYNKILEYFAAAQGDVKKTAISELKGACKHYTNDFFGKDRVNEVKAMKDSGASSDEIGKKIEGFTAELPTEQQEKALVILTGCKKVFEAAEAAKRLRRSSGLQVVQYIIVASKTWLTEEESDKLLALHRQGKDSEVIRKITNHYKTLEDKSYASSIIAASCRLILTESGVENANKQLIESTARMDKKKTLALLRSLFKKLTNETVKETEAICVEAYTVRLL